MVNFFNTEYVGGVSIFTYTNEYDNIQQILDTRLSSYYNKSQTDFLLSDLCGNLTIYINDVCGNLNNLIDINTNNIIELSNNKVNRDGDTLNGDYIFNGNVSIDGSFSILGEGDTNIIDITNKLYSQFGVSTGFLNISSGGQTQFNYLNFRNDDNNYDRLYKNVCFFRGYLYNETDKLYLQAFRDDITQENPVIFLELQLDPSSVSFGNTNFLYSISTPAIKTSTLYVGESFENRFLRHYTEVDFSRHTEIIGEIELSGNVYENGVLLSNTYAPLSHTHTTSDITNLSIYTGFTNYYTKTEVNDICGNLNTYIDTEISDLSSNLNTLISNNATNISTNTTNISNNATNISTNTTNISNNATNISTNTTNISNNATNISNNTSAISTNTTNISNNATNISNNTSAISTNATDIATNTSAISTNTTNISTNATDIATNTSAISTNTSNISANASAISTNTSNISANASAISTNTSNISANASAISTNTSNISANASAISTNTTNISTNATNIATNATDITNLTNDLSNNYYDITTSDGRYARLASSNTFTNDLNTYEGRIKINGSVDNDIGYLTGSYYRCIRFKDRPELLTDSDNLFLGFNGGGAPDPDARIRFSNNGCIAIGANFVSQTTLPIDGLIVEGDMGIGKTDPSYNLDVNGDMNATTLYENGTALSSKYARLASSNTFTDTINIDTDTNNKPLEISRLGNSDNQLLKIGVSDDIVFFNYINDEDTGGIRFRIENTDTETGGGVDENTTYPLVMEGNINGGFVSINSQTVSSSYNLNVNGSANATTLYENGTALTSKYAQLGTLNTFTGEITFKDIQKQVYTSNETNATHILYKNVASQSLPSSYISSVFKIDTEIPTPHPRMARVSIRGYGFSDATSFEVDVFFYGYYSPNEWVTNCWTVWKQNPTGQRLVVYVARRIDDDKYSIIIGPFNTNVASNGSVDSIEYIGGLASFYYNKLVVEEYEQMYSPDILDDYKNWSIGGFSETDWSNNQVNYDNFIFAEDRTEIGKQTIFDNDGINLIYSGTKALGRGPAINFEVNDLTTYPSRRGVGKAQIKALAENATSGNDSTAISFSTQVDDQTMAERMRITSGGNIGVGTTSPTCPLEVAGSIGITGNWVNPIFGSSGRGLFMGHFTDPSPSVGTIFAYDYNTATPMNLYLQRTGGFVGIRVSDPTSFLDVYSEIRSRDDITIQSDTTQTAISTYDSQHAFWINKRTGSDNWKKYMRVNEEGQISIGNDSPPVDEFKLNIDCDLGNEWFHCYGGLGIGRGSFSITTYSSSNYNIIHEIDNTGYSIGHDSSIRNINFRTNSLSRLTILGDGRVGIGTTSPERELEVYSSDNNTALYISNGTDGGYSFIQYKCGNVQQFEEGVNHVSANAPFWYVYSDRDNKYCMRVSRIGGIRFDQYTTNGTLSTTSSNGTIVVSSDRRLKKDIKYLDNSYNAIDELMKYKPCLFKWKNDDTRNQTLGFIAQDLEEAGELSKYIVDGKKYEYEFKTEPIYREKKVIEKVEVIDESGNIILDESGNAIYEEVEKTIMENTKETKVLYDDSGNPLLDYDKPRYRGVSDRAIIAIQTLAIQQQQREIKYLKDEIDKIKSILNI